uniref:Uncharacterized protein n=1 Tax=Anguilla anguilla TaxID=7936 RepID=A0A0E9W9Y6_ANGAN
MCILLTECPGCMSVLTPAQPAYRLPLTLHKRKSFIKTFINKTSQN